MTAILVSKRIMCGGCAKNITETLTKIPGVLSVDVDVLKKSVTVSFDEATVITQNLKDAMSTAGYPTEA